MDSAAGSCKEARDPKTQAILPIFGKVKNAVKGNMGTADVIKNDKLGLALAAFRCGIGEEFDIDKLRYHKIILLADSDPDGSHIQILWTSFIWRYMPEIINQGYLYIPEPPLFQAKKKNQPPKFFYTNHEMQAAKLDSSWEISRFKGLATKPSPYYLFRNTSGVARMCG